MVENCAQGLRADHGHVRVEVQPAWHVCLDSNSGLFGRLIKILRKLSKRHEEISQVKMFKLNKHDLSRHVNGVYFINKYYFIKRHEEISQVKMFKLDL